MADTTARVKVALAPVTIAANATSEQVTQVLLWDPVRVLEVKGEWAQVVVPEQYRTERGYPGWMKVNTLALRPFAVSAGATVTVAYPWVALRERPDPKATVLAQAYMSTRLPLIDTLPKTVAGEPWFSVKLPDGQTAWVRSSQVQAEVAPALAAGEQVVNRAKSLMATPYLWGGMSKQGIDCSGLTYVAYRMNGITLPRDADQQFQVGVEVSPENLLPGDLVFFGQPGDITHVGMYAGNGTIVEATSSCGVGISNLGQGWYKEYYRGARRLLQTEPGGRRVLTPTILSP